MAPLSRVAIALLILGAWAFAQAQTPASVAGQAFPARTVRLIVPFSAGGAVDVPARIFAPKLQEVWGHGVVVENRPGAGSTIGAEAVARAPPDGYTLLLTSNTHLISGSLYRRLAYEPLGDFEPVMELGHAPNVLVVHPSFPAHTVAELIDTAKAMPGRIDYGSSGNGSSQHLFCAMFASMTAIQLNHVPYKGSGQATTDLLAGRVPVSCPGINNVLTHIKAGKLRALAVTSNRRAADLPETPTLAEAGVVGYEATLWIGLLAPKGTPSAVLQKIYADTARVLALDEMKQGWASVGTEVAVKPATELARLMREESVRWAKLIAETGLKVE
jgi:tripartite-type tricarboxylate transporter receptor subunit TctC